MAQLTAWENFYVIVGSSAGALTGLMFVVITLIAGSPARGAGGDVAAYGSPTVVHFSAVLIACALLAAPWQALPVFAVLLSLAGLAGVVYAALVIRRITRRMGLRESYSPVLEDWLWFAALPLVAYLAIVVAAFLLSGSPTPALFIVGGALVLLLIVGIHNAWDTVTYITFERNQPRNTGH